MRRRSVEFAGAYLYKAARLLCSQIVIGTHAFQWNWIDTSRSNAQRFYLLLIFNYSICILIEFNSISASVNPREIRVWMGLLEFVWIEICRKIHFEFRSEIANRNIDFSVHFFFGRHLSSVAINRLKIIISSDSNESNDREFISHFTYHSCCLAVWDVACTTTTDTISLLSLRVSLLIYANHRTMGIGWLPFQILNPFAIDISFSKSNSIKSKNRCLFRSSVAHVCVRFDCVFVPHIVECVQCRKVFGTRRRIKICVSVAYASSSASMIMAAGVSSHQPNENFYNFINECVRPIRP